MTDPAVVVALAALGILAAIGWVRALHRDEVFDRLREILGMADGSGDELERAVRAAVDRTTSAEWAAQQTALDLAHLADLVGVGIVRLDDDLRIDFANAAAHVFLDRPEGSLLERSAVEAFVDPRVEGIARSAHDRGSGTGEVAVGGDGAALVVRARRSPVRGVWLILEDVTELRRLQRIRTEFIDNLSHELRTPVTTLSLLAETLAREADDLPPKTRERVEKIEIETGHLVQMVTELLDLSRIESGRGPSLLLDDVDLRHAAASAVDRLRLFAERHGVTLVVEAPDDLPPVRGDEDRLGQVLINLVHNAVKFSPSGGTVRVGVRIGEGEVIAEVRDDGVGIPAPDLERVFERFYKVDKARVRGRGGTGLGLAIARHVVEAHGGWIRADSEEGRGSTFSFGIPIATSR